MSKNIGLIILLFVVSIYDLKSQQIDMSLSLKHNILPSRIQSENKPPLLIQLHGIGSNKEDLFSFSKMLPEEYFIVSAQAPNDYYGGYAWYNLEIGNGPRGYVSDMSQAKESLATISKFIDECKKTYGTSDKVVLMGFSQGAIMSYALSINEPEKIEAVIAMSGYINLELIKDNPNWTLISKTKYFITHGKLDPILPIDLARMSDKLLTENKIKHSYQEYNMEHSISQECFNDIVNWLKEN